MPHSLIYEVPVHRLRGYKYHLIPLRPLRLMHRQGIGKLNLIRAEGKGNAIVEFHIYIVVIYIGDITDLPVICCYLLVVTVLCYDYPVSYTELIINLKSAII